MIERLLRGGTELQLLALINSLDRTRFTPILCLLDGEDQVSRSLEPENCRIIRLGVTKLCRPSSSARLLSLSRFLRRERVDVLQPYLTDSTYFGIVAGKLAGVPCIVRTRNNINHWMTPTHRFLGRLLNHFVTVTVCNSEAGRQAVLADERPDPNSVVVIENGVDLERFANIPPVSPVRKPGAALHAGMVANLRPVKGVDVFIRAAAVVVRSHPDVVFHVAGEGSQRTELERLIADLGLTNRFLLRGKVVDIPGFLADLDIAVLSSRAEGMPNAVLEYMAAGRPIVATQVGGVSQMLGEREGLVVAPSDHEALAGALVRLLENPQLSATIAREARRRAFHQYSRQRVVHLFQELFQELCQKHVRDRS